MKNFNIIIAIVTVLLYSSCENEIPFNEKNNPPKIVLNAIIDINSEENYIFLTKTGKQDTDSVPDATVNIYVNDELKEQLTEYLLPEINMDDELSGMINYPEYIEYLHHIYRKNKQYTTKMRFQPGDKVKIEVLADNNKYHVWAEDIVPYPVEIEQIDTTTYNKDYSTYMRLRTTFTDSGNKTNFYRLVLTQKTTVYGKRYQDSTPDSVSYQNAIFLDTREDIVLNDGKVISDEELFPQTENVFAVFDDTRLNGTYTTKVSFYRPTDVYYMDIIPERASIDFEVLLMSITEFQYYYLKALNILSSDNYDEYLSMPVSFPSNVEGGTGIVGFSSDTRKSFSIPDIIPDKNYWHSDEGYPY